MGRSSQAGGYLSRGRRAGSARRSLSAARARRARRDCGPRAGSPRGRRRACDAPWSYCDVTDRGERRGGRRASGGRARRARRRRRQRGGRRPAADRRRQPGRDGAHDRGQRDRRLQHRARGRPARRPRRVRAPRGSLAAAMHLPMLGAYCASKAAVEALGNSLRAELRPLGARVGVAYFGELDTDMTSRGFGTRAARKLFRGDGAAHRPVAPWRWGSTRSSAGSRAARAESSRPDGSPDCCRRGWPCSPSPRRLSQRRLAEALQIAREEDAPLTTPQPGART